MPGPVTTDLSKNPSLDLEGLVGFCSEKWPQDERSAARWRDKMPAKGIRNVAVGFRRKLFLEMGSCSCFVNQVHEGNRCA